MQLRQSCGHCPRNGVAFIEFGKMLSRWCYMHLHPIGRDAFIDLQKCHSDGLIGQMSLRWSCRNCCRIGRDAFLNLGKMLLGQSRFLRISRFCTNVDEAILMAFQHNVRDWRIPTIVTGVVLGHLVEHVIGSKGSRYGL